MKYKLSDGAIPHYQQWPWSDSQGLLPRLKPVSVSKILSFSSRHGLPFPDNAFRTQEWLDLARDDVSRLHLTPPLVSLLVCFGFIQKSSHLLLIRTDLVYATLLTAVGAHQGCSVRDYSASKGKPRCKPVTFFTPSKRRLRDPIVLDTQ
jgi:hypothetical protein